MMLRTNRNKPSSVDIEPFFHQHGQTLANSPTYQPFTNHLPTIYQPITNHLPGLEPYPFCQMPFLDHFLHPSIAASQPWGSEASRRTPLSCTRPTPAVSAGAMDLFLHLRTFNICTVELYMYIYIFIYIIYNIFIFIFIFIYIYIYLFIFIFIYIYLYLYNTICVYRHLYVHI
jgi:hypothetical protein